MMTFIKSILFVPMGCLYLPSILELSSFGFKCFQRLWHLLLGLLVGSRRYMLPPVDNHLLLQPATSLALKITERKVTSFEIVSSFIERIKLVNPILNAMIQDNFKAALEDAKKADQYILDTCTNNGILLLEQAINLAEDKPLLGVPFTVKNSIGVKNMTMDAGIVKRAKYKAEEDSDVVLLLKEAGAIPICITNVPEYCMGRETYNAIYGRTNNPYDLTRVPGGSSGGEGALIASAASVIGIGNDLCGSLRFPAFCCSLFAHKPSLGIVSNQGQFPCYGGTHLDHFLATGPLCRYSIDLLPLLKVMAGKKLPKLKLYKEISLKRLKIYYTDDYEGGLFDTPLSQVLFKSVHKVVRYLEDSIGIKTIRVKFPVAQKEFLPIWLNRLAISNGPDVLEAVAKGKPNIFLEFLKYAFGYSKHSLSILLHMLIKRKRASELEMTAQNIRYAALEAELKDYFDELLADHGVLVFPTQPELANFHQEQFFQFSTASYTCLFNLFGYPVTQCPVGFDTNSGLPFGVQLIATRYKDRLTLKLAEEIEKGLGGWKEP